MFILIINSNIDVQMTNADHFQYLFLLKVSKEQETNSLHLSSHSSSLQVVLNIFKINARYMFSMESRYALYLLISS